MCISRGTVAGPETRHCGDPGLALGGSPCGIQVPLHHLFVVGTGRTSCVCLWELIFSQSRPVPSSDTTPQGLEVKEETDLLSAFPRAVAQEPVGFTLK